VVVVGDFVGVLAFVYKYFVVGFIFVKVEIWVDIDDDSFAFFRA